MILSRQQLEATLTAVKREDVDEVDVSINDRGQLVLKVPTVHTTYRQIPLVKRSRQRQAQTA